MNASLNTPSSAASPPSSWSPRADLRALPPELEVGTVPSRRRGTLPITPVVGAARRQPPAARGSIARRLVAIAALAACAWLLLPSIASAHHTTVSCQSPGVWLIVNSETDKSMTFTTDQGHTGSIGAGGSTTVGYSGTSLTVHGIWSNGVTNTSTGTGDCTVNTTTTEASTTSTSAPSTTTSTTEPSTSTTSTSSSTTTTVAETTTTSEVTTSTIEEPTTTPDPTTTTSSSVSTTTVPSTSTTVTDTSTPTTPATSLPSVPSSTLPPPSSDTPTTTLPQPSTTVNSGDCFSTSSTALPTTSIPSISATPCVPPSLPATGPSDALGYVAAVAGLCCIFGALTVRWSRR